MIISSIKKALLVTFALNAAIFAFDDHSFEAGNIWGWGYQDTTEIKPSTESPDKDTLTKAVPKQQKSMNIQKDIPYFDEFIGNLLLQKDFATLANADTIRSYCYKLGRAQRIHRYLATEESEKLKRDVYIYLASPDWETDLQNLKETDAAFIEAVVYMTFINNFPAHHVQALMNHMEDNNQLNFFKKMYNIKSSRETLKANHWFMMVGLDGNFFSNGANDKIGPGIAYKLGFGYCLVGRYCGEFNIGSIAGDPYKEDVIQSGISYPKKIH